MPKVTVHDKFEVRLDYDEVTHLAKEIAAVRGYLEKELACVAKSSVSNISVSSSRYRMNRFRLLR